MIIVGHQCKRRWFIMVVTLSCSDSSWLNWKEEEEEERWWNWRELLRHCGHGRGSCTAVHSRQIHFEVLGFCDVRSVHDGSDFSERHWVGTTDQWWPGKTSTDKPRTNSMQIIRPTLVTDFVMPVVICYFYFRGLRLLDDNSFDILSRVSDSKQNKFTGKQNRPSSNSTTSPF